MSFQAKDKIEALRKSSDNFVGPNGEFASDLVLKIAAKELIDEGHPTRAISILHELARRKAKWENKKTKLFPSQSGYYVVKYCDLTKGASSLFDEIIAKYNFAPLDASCHGWQLSEGIIPGSWREL